MGTRDIADFGFVEVAGVGGAFGFLFAFADDLAEVG